MTANNDPSLGQVPNKLLLEVRRIIAEAKNPEAFPLEVAFQKNKELLDRSGFVIEALLDVRRKQALSSGSLDAVPVDVLLELQRFNTDKRNSKSLSMETSIRENKRSLNRAIRIMNVLLDNGLFDRSLAKGAPIQFDDVHDENQDDQNSKNKTLAPDGERDEQVWAFIAIAEQCGAKKDEGDNGRGPFWSLHLDAMYALEAKMREAAIGIQQSHQNTHNLLEIKNLIEEGKHEEAVRYIEAQTDGLTRTPNSINADWMSTAKQVIDEFIQCQSVQSADPRLVSQAKDLLAQFPENNPGSDREKLHAMQDKIDEITENFVRVCRQSESLRRFITEKPEPGATLIAGPWQEIDGYAACRESNGKRVAFIEKTPRVLSLGGEWIYGDKGCDQLYGKDPESRAWCDAKLRSMGYVLEDDNNVELSRQNKRMAEALRWIADHANAPEQAARGKHRGMAAIKHVADSALETARQEEATPNRPVASPKPGRR